MWRRALQRSCSRAALASSELLHTSKPKLKLVGNRFLSLEVSMDDRVFDSAAFIHQSQAGWSGWVAERDGTRDDSERQTVNAQRRRDVWKMCQTWISISHSESVLHQTLRSPYNDHISVESHGLSTCPSVNTLSTDKQPPTLCLSYLWTFRCCFNAVSPTVDVTLLFAASELYILYNAIRASLLILFL